MAGRIATVTGTMLAPGVSRNRRLYSKQLIAKAVGRMQERIADPDGLPIVMRTHHDAGDNSRLIVGRLTDVKLREDGSAQYMADLYDTGPGRDIAGLVVPGKGQPAALRSVSIYGYWLGPVKQVEYEGESVTTADDLEIDAVDFTSTPGVLGATVTAAAYVHDAPPATESTATGRTPISEAMEATVEPVTEEAPDEEAYSAQQKRDALAKGQAMKNADGKPSYPIKSKADLRKAIRAVGRGGADHDKIRAHIIQRAKALGLLAMIPDNWNQDGTMKETAGATRLGEIREFYPDGPAGGAGFCIDAYNGPISLTMRACNIDPAELRVITAAAMKAAVDALQAMDPDMDADIDVDGAPNADTDGDTDQAEAARPQDGSEEDMETAAGQSLKPEHMAALKESGALDQLQPGDVVTAAMVNEALTQTSPASPVEDSPAHTTEVPAVSEPTSPAAETASTPQAPMIALTQEQFAALLDRVAPARETAAQAEAPTTETTPAPAEPVAQETTAEPAPASDTAESITKATLEEALKAQIPAILSEYGLPPRKGYRTSESDTTPNGGEKPPSADELWAKRVEILLGDHGQLPTA